MADRDLAIQDFTVVVVPGMRLSCLARAAAWNKERGACGARWETLVWRRVGRGAWPIALKPVESTRPFGRFS